MKQLGLALLGILISFAARAEFYQGIREMGMGGASVAVVDDETSMLLNPIGLGRLRSPYVTIIDPEITAGAANLSTVKDLALHSANVNEVYNAMATHVDQRYYFREQLFPSFADRNWGIGFLIKDEVMAVRHSAGTMDLDYANDQAVVAGYNHSFSGGIIKVGANGRLIDRVGYNGVLDPSTQTTDPKNFAREGLGLGGDVGVSVSSPTALLPTLSVVARDVGDTSFTLGDGYRSYPHGVAPDKIPMSVDVGLAVFPIWSNASRGTFTIEYDDAMNTGKTSKKLHGGVEIDLADRLFLRGGWNSGYPTVGLEWAGAFFQLQMAYYGEEVGTDDNPIRDNRYSLKAVIRF